MLKTVQNDFLLYYNKIVFFIDNNVNHSRPNIFFKWNVIPKSFAYRAPYIYVFTLNIYLYGMKMIRFIKNKLFLQVFYIFYSIMIIIILFIQRLKMVNIV